jgi:hypothetical protein
MPADKSWLTIGRRSGGDSRASSEHAAEAVSRMTDAWSLSGERKSTA